MLVVDRGLVAWEASGRNGGGCTHHFSPLFAEEQRLWPRMDELLGYPTEFRPERIRIAADEHQLELYGRAVRNAARQGFVSEALDSARVRELVPLAGEDNAGGYFHHFGGHANPQRTVQAYAWAMQDHGGRLLQHTRCSASRRRVGACAACAPIAARSAASIWFWRPARAAAGSPPCSACMCRWSRRARR